MSKKWEDNSEHNREMMVDAIMSQRESQQEPTNYQAPGAEQKWHARDLLDIHWNLVGNECPESFRAIMSCIVGHANPNNGVCNPRHKTIAIETGYSVKTVKLAIKWWVEQGFLKTEARSLGHALAYHPQWAMFEMFWTAVASDIAAQKSKHLQGVLRVAPTGGATGVGPYGVLQNLKDRTSKIEPHPKGDHQPSAAVPCTTSEANNSIQEKKGVSERPPESQPTAEEKGRRLATIANLKLGGKP